MAVYDAVDSGEKWLSPTVTYTFGDSDGNIGDSGDGVTNIQLFNADQQATARAIFAHIEEFTNINFVEAASTGQIAFLSGGLPNGTGGFAYYPSAVFGSDVFIDNTYNSAATAQNAGYYGLDAGNFGYTLFLHEIGHALGLEHPHEGAATLSTADNTMNATVMSYNASSASSTGGQVASLVGPMANQTYQLYDIAVLQAKYGANTSHNADDTLYSFTGAPNVRTIWDGAGNDTIDGSTYIGNSTIDLREGLENISTIGDSSLWIAFNANIENAFGGAGNDSITGNSLANIIKGGGGNDTLIGNEGDDWFNGNAGNDTISADAGADEVRGGKGQDSLSGGSGADFINGNNDADSIYGNAGVDTIHGGKSNDKIFAGAGDDLIYGDLGNDTLTGNKGADRFIFKSNAEHDTISDFVAGEDIIQFVSTGLNSDNIVGQVSFTNLGAIIVTSSESSIFIANMDATDFLATTFDFV